MEVRRDSLGRAMPPNKPKGREAEQRANAFAAARYALDNPVNREEAAIKFNTNGSAVSEAMLVLKHGTQEEIEGVLAGKIGMKAMNRIIRARVSPGNGKRLLIKQVVIGEKGKATLKVDAAVWTELRAALEAISNMPQAADAVKIARKNSQRTDVVNRLLMTSLTWITEFSDAWTK